MSTESQKKELHDNKQKSKLSLLIRLTGVSLIIVGVLVLLFNYLPILVNRVNYIAEKDDLKLEAEIFEEEIDELNDDLDQENSIGKESELSKYFPDANFSLYLPTIGARSKVIEKVDPFNSFEYNKALEKGIAHAENGYHPGSGGNTFLFAHSALDFYALRSLNVNFYLLDELEIGDKIYVSYKGKIFTYTVTDIKIVKPTEIDYLKKRSENESITLMTCWPAGTDYKRVIVYGEISE